MEKVEPMDILRMPSPEEETMAEITTWVKTLKDNKAANCTTVVFNTKENFRFISENNDLFSAMFGLEAKKEYIIEN